MYKFITIANITLRKISTEKNDHNINMVKINV